MAPRSRHARSLADNAIGDGNALGVAEWANGRVPRAVQSTVLVPSELRSDQLQYDESAEHESRSGCLTGIAHNLNWLAIGEREADTAGSLPLVPKHGLDRGEAERVRKSSILEFFHRQPAGGRQGYP